MSGAGRRLRLRLVNRSSEHLEQFSEYEVNLDGEVIGTVQGSARTGFSHHRGHRVVVERTWVAHPGKGHVGTRREALIDLLRVCGINPDDLTADHAALRSWRLTNIEEEA
jgi:hypothetical protein